LPSIKDLQEKASDGMMWGAHQLLRARGFKWEVRRNGEIHIGMWRKVFRKNTLRKPIPTRLVFIPGFGDTPLSWLPIMTLIEPVLRSNYDEVVMLDLPGYNGLLVTESLFPTIEAVFDSLFDVLDGLKPKTVMGHSLGGFMSAHYAAACSSGKRPTGKPQTYRDLISTIVIDPSGVLETEENRQEWARRLDRLVKEGGKFWRPFIFAKEPFWFRLIGGHFLKFISRAEVEPFMRSITEKFELHHVLPDIHSKIAILWGEEDTLIPAELARYWLKHLTNTSEPANVTLIRGSGHSPQIEATATTAVVLAQILSGRKPHAAGRRWYRIMETA
jgi:pimeloyl-ACP methyl ester carboxylesterase